MAKKQIKKARRATAKKTVVAVKKARQGKAAKVKPPKSRAKADRKTLHGTTKPWTPAEVEEAFRRFQAAMPEPKGELQSINAFTLLVAVVLSAQATDAGVNKATRALFKIADTPERMLALGEEKLRDYIKTIGLFRTKAKNVIALSQRLIDDFGSKVPGDRDTLETLPGVGRKSANVVLNTAFGEPTLAVDTHVFRLANRLAIAPGKTPRAVEDELMRVVPKRFLPHAHHWLILHGRYVCMARKPLCGVCVLVDLCPYEPKSLPGGQG